MSESDRNPEGRDLGLGGEAMRARSEGLAQSEAAMTYPKDVIEQIAAALSDEDKIALLDLPAYEPWLMGNPAAYHDYWSRLRFYYLKLIESVFPEAKPGDSGRQFWRFNRLGLDVRAHLPKDISHAG